MNAQTQINQPAVLATLADSFGCDPDVTALLASAIAAGLAGSHAGLKSGLGMTYPGFSVAIASADPSWGRLQNTLLEPVLHFHEHLRKHCKSLHPEQVDTRSTLQRLGVGRELSIAETEDDPFHSIPIAYQRRQAVLNPTMIISDPDSKTYERGLKETADHAPLVVSGFPSAGLTPILARDCRGADRIFESEQGSLQKVHPRLLLHCTPDQLQSEFRARNPLLNHVIIAAPTHESKRSVTLEFRRQAIQKYISVVRECIKSRYSGSGILYQISDPVAGYLEDAAAEIDDMIRSLAPEVQPYLLEASSLPARLLWAFKLFSVGGNPAIQVGAVETAKSIVKKSANLLSSLVGSIHDDAEVIMLSKLNDKPQPFRELARRYSRQSRAVHQPVLGRLVQKGFVREMGDLLHVTEPGREHLNRVQTSRSAS